MQACSDQLPPVQELDHDTLVQWILTKPRWALH
jgi:hypothetical protein